MVRLFVERYFVQMLIAFALTFAVCSAVNSIAVVSASGEQGRWKSDGGGGCYWDENDSGPDQCQEVPGRWKDDGVGGCYWEGTDSGPHQCIPASVSEEPPPGTEQPYIDENTPIEYAEDYGMAEAEQPGAAFPSCIPYHQKNGPAGYIAVQKSGPGASVMYGAYMWKSWENYGLWTVNEFVNGVVINSKRQFYPPHGSQPISVVPNGSVFGLNVVHWYMKFSWYWRYTYLPELGGWRLVPIPTYLPARATGSTGCRA